jgi:drug/metabolite transporter (DMT)-like permease
LIFGEIPSPRTLFGVVLIAGAGLFVFLRGPKTSVLGGFERFVRERPRPGIIPDKRLAGPRP